MKSLMTRFFVLMLAIVAAPSLASGLEVMKDFQGIAYTEQGSAVGMPMGGIGAGCIEITSKGTLAEFAHLNNWTLRVPSIKGTGLYLTYRSGSKTLVFPLGEQKVKFEGNFPFAKLTFPNLPVKLTLWCWSPFILHDARHSAYPVAIFDAQVVNTSATKAEIGLALSYGTDYGAWTRYLAPDTLKDVPTISMRSTPKLYSGKQVNGISFSTVAEQNPVANYIYPNANADITLSARAQSNGKVFTYQLEKPESVTVALAEGKTSSEAKPATYSVEQRINLAPGKSGVIGLLASWYAPSHFNYNGYRLGHKYEEWFKTSADAAEEVARNHEMLLTKTKRDYDLTAKTTLPKWYREMVQSNFYLLPSTTWWTKDGISFTYESPNGCPLHGTMDVSYYGSFTVLAAFPELYEQAIRQYCKLQTPEGYIPHNLGGTGTGVVHESFQMPDAQAATDPKPGSESYKGFRADTNVKFCLEIYRQYQWTGDKAFVEEVWPNLKRAMAWIINLDDDKDGLPEVNYGYDSWQMVNKVEYISNEWIICLKAVERLAQVMDEPQYTAQLESIRQKASASFQKYFWTGKYFRQGVVSESANDDMISSLQASGSWYATMLGIDDGISHEQIRSGLKIIDEVNGKDAVYGISVVIHPDGKRSGSWQQFICDTGWALYYASHCIYEGMDDTGLKIADEIWQQFTVKKVRLPWCQPNVIEKPWDINSGTMLNRDMRQGVTMTMGYAAAGLRMDIPAQSVSITPANFVWSKGKFVLPATMPKWLGQVKYSRSAKTELYILTNQDSPIKLKSLELRTAATGKVSVYVDGHRRNASVSSNGTVDAGALVLGKKVQIHIVMP